MILVNAMQCTGCGACADICHEDCIDLSNGSPVIDQERCSTCAQCVARCPSQALSWDGTPPQPFAPANLPTLVQLEELFKQRRSIRYFTGNPIPREVLRQIAGSGAFAPTHNFSLRLVVVDDARLITGLENILVDYIDTVYRFLFKPGWIGWVARVFGQAGEYQRARPKVEWCVTNRKAFVNRPAALIFILGNRHTPLSEASAQYALANMQYTAQVLGVGACLWGNAPLFIDKNHKARQSLGVHTNERIYGALYLGYPAVEFQNKVEGKRLSVAWNGGQQEN